MLAADGEPEGEEKDGLGESGVGETAARAAEIPVLWAATASGIESVNDATALLELALRAKIVASQM